MASQTTPTRRRPRRLRDAHPARRPVVLAWWGFTGTFALLRLLTWLIHIHVAGLGNVSARGVHVHHYLWGIVVMAGVAASGLVERSTGWRAWMGFAFGVGLALVVDEIALLVELKDVYWSGAGAVSVGAGVILIGLVGSVLVLTRSERAEQDD
jgi:hypothetical protein